MNRKSMDTLKSELQAAGATEHELDSLARIAGNLGNLSSNVRKKSVRSRMLRVSVVSASVMAVLAALIIVSQAVLPGSLLYPIQRTSDDVAIRFDSSYRGTVMMRSADQVRKLVEKNAPSGDVLHALALYKQQAASYESDGSNYAAFEYCKHSLKVAASNATPPERQAIDATLATLDAV